MRSITFLNADDINTITWRLRGESTQDMLIKVHLYDLDL